MISAGRVGMLVVFPFLAFAAVQLLFVRCLYQNGLVPKLHSVCDAAVDEVSFPTRIAYTNIPALDFNICAIVAFYHGIMNPTYRPLLIHMCTALSAIAIIPFVEATRESSRSAWRRMPATTGMVFQLGSCAVIMPLYWFAFALTGGTTHRGASDNISQRNAEALLSALLVGYALPTVCMVVLEKPVMTAIWQIFPIYMKFAHWAHTKIRPPSPYAGSGYRTVQAMYMLVFIASAFLHATYIWPLFTSPTLFQKNTIPPTAPLDPTRISIAESVAAFLKWDMVFGTGSTILITLWFARSPTDLVLLMLWHAVATIAVGPGAAIAGAMLWREATINARAIANADKTQ